MNAAVIGAELLDEHLTDAARQSGWVIGRQTDAHAALRAAIADDPDLAAAARAELSRVGASGVLERDHITRWRKATLEGALPP